MSNRTSDFATLDNLALPSGQAKRATFAEDVVDPEPKAPVKVEERRKFENNIQAVISVIANAVGLGNVWRFPYMCFKNGGGAFFVPYVLMLIIAAMPIMGMEIAWGQFTSLGPVDSWNCYPLLGGVGIAGAVINWLIMIYYSVLTAYALFYLVASLYSLKDINSPVWEGCGHFWNSKKCQTVENLKKQFANGTLPKSGYVLPTDEFWLNYVSEDDGTIRYMGYPNWKMVIALFVVWCIVLVSIWRGARSLGKSSYFFAIFPYFCIIFLLVAGMFKDGAAEGVLVYLIPDFSKLLELQVWADAGQQIFFSLSLSQSVMGALSSFNDFHQQCLTNTLIVVVVNCVTSFWIGFPIFAVLGHMAHELGTTVDKVIGSGPGLAFVAYPQALSLLPGAAIWSIFFCAMVLSVGLGSCTTCTESFIGMVIDAFPTLQTRKKEIAFRCCFIFSFFLLGLPMINRHGGMHLLNLVDGFCTGINSYIIALAMCIVLGSLYGIERFCEDVALMTGHRPNCYWRITWRYLSPIFLIFMGMVWILNKAKEYGTEPYWAVSLGWTISVVSILAIPLYAVYIMCRQPTGLSCEAYRSLTEPNDKWGPEKEEDRIGRYGRRSGFEKDVET